jgi:NADH:ubiquinone reductase (H+-translocating)
MHKTRINIPETGKKRVVIIGGGFGGLALARKLAGSEYQVVLIDKNNYHQFQPLFYQVAMAGLEPSSIVFPLRKLFQRHSDVYIRVTEATQVEPEKKRVLTPLGICNYDYLVLAVGADTNFFGNEHIAEKAIPMKSVSEALFLRNQILSDYEKALTTTDFEERQGYIDIVIAGGGPTGVEVAGALAEMKKYILPKDYPELNSGEIEIYLIEGAPALLGGMSEESSQKALAFLEQLGVIVKLNTLVVDYDGETVFLSDGSSIRSRKLIWAAGVRGNSVEGLPVDTLTRGGRIKVNRFSQVEGFEDIFAIGDIAWMAEEKYPDGHPQVAQPAIQQGRRLAENLRRMSKGKEHLPFSYKDLGSMATIGRNRAVVDLPAFKTQGLIAWFIWLFVHLFQILGIKNRLFIFLNWVWNYITYDQSLRLIIRPKVPQREKSEAD